MWLTHNNMADRSHEPDGGFPTQDEIREFLRGLQPRADAALAESVRRSFHTVEKWFRPNGGEMSAVNLLRVIIALEARDEFVAWLSKYEATPRVQRVAEGLKLYNATREASNAGRAHKGTAKGK